MGTPFADEPDAAGGITERDQVFAHESHPRGRTVRRGDFFGEQCGNPVAADQIAHGCPRIGSGN